MADEVLKRDQNHITVLGGITDNASQEIVMLRVDPTTKRLLVSATGVGSGTVTSISQGTGIVLTPNPITTTGTVALSVPLQPIATLAGNSLKFLRVNVGETAVEYATVSAGLTVGTTTITSGTDTRILYNNAGVLGEYVISGSGNVAMTTSPVFTTPNIGVATATSINGLTITSSTGTLTITNGKTVSHSATTTFAGTDGKTLTISNSGTLAGGDAFVLAIAAAKTFTVSNTLTLAGTDSTVMTFPTTSATIARTDAANTFTGLQTFATVKITGGSAGSGKVLTSDADGDATWETPSGAAATTTAGVSAGPASSTTQTITHGLGRTPITIRITGIGLGETSTSGVTTNRSTGIWTSVSGSKTVYSINGNGAAQPVSSSALTIALQDGSVGAFTATGVVGNVGATTFDIVWTTSSSAANAVFVWDAQ